MDMDGIVTCFRVSTLLVYSCSILVNMTRPGSTSTACSRCPQPPNRWVNTVESCVSEGHVFLCVFLGLEDAATQNTLIYIHICTFNLDSIYKHVFYVIQ